MKRTDRTHQLEVEEEVTSEEAEEVGVPESEEVEG